MSQYRSIHTGSIIDNSVSTVQAAFTSSNLVKYTAGGLEQNLADILKPINKDKAFGVKPDGSFGLLDISALAGVSAKSTMGFDITNIGAITTVPTTAITTFGDKYSIGTLVTDPSGNLGAITTINTSEVEITTLILAGLQGFSLSLAYSYDMITANISYAQNIPKDRLNPQLGNIAKGTLVFDDYGTLGFCNTEFLNAWSVYVFTKHLVPTGQELFNAIMDTNSVFRVVDSSGKLKLNAIASSWAYPQELNRSDDPIYFDIGLVTPQDPRIEINNKFNDPTGGEFLVTAINGATSECISLSVTAARLLSPTSTTHIWSSWSALRTGPYYNFGTSVSPQTNDYAIYKNNEGNLVQASYSGTGWEQINKVSQVYSTSINGLPAEFPDETGEIELDIRAEHIQYTDDTTVDVALEAIEAVIPETAADDNLLVTTDQLNDAISSNVARYLSPTEAGDTSYASLAALQIGPYYYAGETTSPTNNDYAMYTDTSNRQCRAVYVKDTWVFQYIVNDTPFTTAQLDAINSTATQTKIDQIATNTANIAPKISIWQCTVTSGIDTTAETFSFAPASASTAFNRITDGNTSLPNIRVGDLLRIKDTTYSSPDQFWLYVITQIASPGTEPTLTCIKVHAGNRYKRVALTTANWNTVGEALAPNQGFKEGFDLTNITNAPMQGRVIGILEEWKSTPSNQSHRIQTLTVQYRNTPSTIHGTSKVFMRTTGSAGSTGWTPWKDMAPVQVLDVTYTAAGIVTVTVSGTPASYQIRNMQGTAIAGTYGALTAFPPYITFTFTPTTASQILAGSWKVVCGDAANYVP